MKTGWNVGTLKEHVDARFADAHNAVQAALAAADRASAKADAATEKRFDAVNEFRSVLGDQQRTLLPRAEFEEVRRAYEGRLARLETAVLERAAQGAGTQLGWLRAAGVAAIAGAAVALALKMFGH